MAVKAILGAGSLALQLWGRDAAIKERQASIRLRESYNQSLLDLNELAIKASYARNIRANMLSESITLGRQATGLAKANIGVAGTAVPAFQAVIAKTDFDNQGYDLNRMTQLGRIATSRAASRTAYEKNIGGWGTVDFIGAGGDIANFANDMLKAYG